MGDTREKVGNVILDLSLYGGEDLYSEGEAEDRLLDVVKNNTEDRYNRLIGESGSWSMLYHLSDIRENIADFLNINKTDTVLEIGSGCGAVTGAFAKKAGKVTCVELSHKRSLINAERHGNFDNIEIKVGNFQDIEKTLTEKYDYITLIGVFEYAGSYISSDSPYEEMLSMLKGHLKDGGRIVIAIENKYGLKYFAGCREDHTGGFYDGIEGYRSTDEVRTFSRDGILKMAKKQGFETFFYYPYPDYKLPVTIYSDERLPRVSELSDNIRNFDYDRFVGFDEGAAFDELIREGNFPYFSNSFLAVMSMGDKVEGIKDRKTVYSRHSIERRRKLQIRTDLEVGENGERVIAKYPANDAAAGHLENTARAYERLESVFTGTKLAPNRLKRINDGEGGLKRLEFEFISGPTLEDELNICLAEDRAEDALLVIRNYCDTLKNLKDMTDFKMTDAFKEIFGEVSLPGNLKCMPVTDLDLIFTNIIVNKDWNIIDYEWTFDFPIPVDFVIYRAIRYFADDTDGADLNGGELFKEAGISDEMRDIFDGMEHSFQTYIKGDRITLPEMYSIMGKNTLGIDNAVNRDKRLGKTTKIKLYFDKGEGFNEEDTLFYDAHRDERDLISFEIEVPQGCRNLRIDPADKNCVIKIKEINAGNKECEILVNGIVFGDGTIFYDTDDPQIVVNGVTPGQVLHAGYLIDTLEGEMFSDMAGSFKGEKKPSYKSVYKGMKKGYSKLKI